MDNQLTEEIDGTTFNQPKNRLLFMVAGGVVLVLIGFLLGFGVGSKLQYKSVDMSNIQITPFPSVTPILTQSPIGITPTPPPSKTIIKIPGWLTYTNFIHKYTVQYPPDWIIDSTEADKLEKYDNSVCCNTAKLEISNGDAKWIFEINVMYTGFDTIDECQEESDLCEYTKKSIKVMGYPLTRVATRQKSSDKVIEAYIDTPVGESSSHHGFGQVGISTPYVNPDKIKYFLNYLGSGVEKELATLDRITESLKAIE